MPVIRIHDFSGGLNSLFRQNVVEDNQSPSLRNARFLRSGALTKRLGTSRTVIPTSSMASDSNGLVSAFSYRFNPMGGVSDPANDQVLIAGYTEIVSTTDVTSFTNRFTGMTSQNTFINFLALNNKVYIFNDTADAVRTLDNTNATGTVAAIPNGRCVAEHKGYVFVWGNTNTNYNRLQWSSRNAPETWPAANIEDIDANDGNRAYGIFSFGDELLLFKVTNLGSSFKQSKMYRILGDTFDPSNPTYLRLDVPLPGNIGLIGFKTMKIFQGNLVFMTNTGFYAYRGGGYPPHKISSNLGFNINSEDTTSILGSANRAAIVYQDRYYCSSNQTSFAYGAGTLFNYRVFMIDENGKFWQDYIDSGADNFNPGGACAVDWFIHNENLYSITSFSNLTNHLVRRWEIASTFTEPQEDNTSGNVNFSYLTKEFDLKSEVFFERCYVHLRRQTSGTLTFEVNTDQRGIASSSLDMTTGDTGTTENASSLILKKEVNIQRIGRTIQFRFYDRGNNDCEIYEIELHYKDI